MAISKRTEKEMIRVMRGVKLIEKRSNDELMDLLGLGETLGKLARANETRWYGYALRKVKDDVMRRALDYIRKCSFPVKA